MLSIENSDLADLLETWQAESRQKLVELGLVALVAQPDQATLKTKPKPEAKSKSNPGNSSSNPPATQTEPATEKIKVKYRVEILDDDELPTDLDIASGMELFLATLAGKSKETVRTYRTGCRRFLTFLYTTGRGQPTHISVNKLPISILERYHDWLLTNYTNSNSTKSAGGNKQGSPNTVMGYMAAARNLFEYLSSRNISPGGAQYQRLVARLPKLQARSGGYRTPRALRTRQNQESIEQLARLAAHPSSSQLHPVLTNADTNFSNNSEAASRLVTNDVEVEDATGLEAEGATLASPRRKRSQQIRDVAEIERRKLEAARNRAIILTLYTTGMRRHEVAALNRPELETLLTLRQKDKARLATNQAASSTEVTLPQTTEIKPVYELMIRGKGSKERFVYFDEITLEAILEYLSLRSNDNYQPLFLQHHRGRDARPSGEKGENWRVGAGTVWEIAVDFGREKLGVTIRPHDFRHNLATVLLNAGAKLEEVQDLLGHSSPATTKLIYAHYSQQHLKDVFNRFRNPASG